MQYSGDREKFDSVPNLISTPITINGPVAKQIEDASKTVLTMLRAGLRLNGGFLTQYQIPERAIIEAITNAVIHRDYYTKRDIEIKIFENRVEIQSPGLLPFNITPSNIGIERAFGYRNDLLVKHLRDFPQPPNLDQNEGVRAMRSVMKKENLFPPIFSTYPEVQDGVKVILLNEKMPSEWDKIVNFLQKNKYISNQEARKILNQDIYTVSKLFNKWVRQGVLTKIVPKTGAKRNVKYRLPNTDEEENLFSFIKNE
ncbi:MAG: ATP-binding protein [bacterium]|nr:ATP-binding protein [bacterium]